MSNRERGFALAGLAACLVVSAVPTLAQDQGGGERGGGERGGGERGGRRGSGGFQRGRRGPGGPGEFGDPNRFGGQQEFGNQRGPGGGAFGQGGPFAGRGEQDKNPLITHVFELINRPDVQNEIGMDLRQRNALSQFRSEMQNDIRQQMRQMFQGQRGGVQGGQNDPGGSDGQADQPGQNDQRGRGRRGRQDPRGGQQGQQGQPGQGDIQQREQSGIEKGLKDLLKPEQVRRLYQLDLQWRGVLSIADPAVADELQVGQQVRTSIAGLVTEYQAAVREARQQQMQSFREQRRGETSGNINQRAGIRQDPLIALERADMEARKEAEEKAVQVLSATERSSWTQLQGKPFTFRTDIRTPQRGRL